MKLNDKHIRNILIQKLNNQPVKPKAIIQELNIHNGNAIADVVTLHNEAHCYEIKGDGDKIERILEQGKYYNLSFRKITLVTTSKHLSKAIKLAPSFWGIMIAEFKKGRIVVKYIRKALNNPMYDKNKALLTLWKEEMLNLIDSKDKKTTRKSRTILAELIANTKQKLELSQDITVTLIDRYKINKYNQLTYM